MNNELVIINNWLISNRLSINTDKTHFIFYTHKTMSYQLMQIGMNNHSIGEVEQTKFVGYCE